MRRIFCFLLVVFAIPQFLIARIVYTWTYQEMFDKADLVVIARYVSTKDTRERTTLEDIEPPIQGIGLVSEFESRLVLKGPKDITKFRLHHYRIENPELIANGPRLVTIEPGRHPTFLLFLIKERDGRYAPVSGQTDPAAFSVVELTGGAN